jgi:hypothetical protein
LIPADCTKDLQSITKDDLMKLNEAQLDRFLRMNGLQPTYTAAILKEKVKKEEIQPTALYRYLYEEGAGPSANQIYGAEIYRSDDEGVEKDT